MKNSLILLILSGIATTCVFLFMPGPGAEKPVNTAQTHLLDASRTAQYYANAQLTGHVLIYDESKNHSYVYNPAGNEVLYSPASTFKICHSLIALETGVIPNIHTVIPHDGVQRRLPVWNQDHDMQMAFRNSTVWFYQELAHRIGAERMQLWIDSLNYGNRDISGNVQEFWLDGTLRINAHQQIDFLKQLYHGQLPLSARSQDLVKEIMVQEQTPAYTLRAKTGWMIENDTNIGWYTGWVEKKGKVYYFAHCVQDTLTDNPQFADARVSIVKSILKDLDILD
jgi:beta-lactamase class D